MSVFVLDDCGDFVFSTHGQCMNFKEFSGQVFRYLMRTPKASVDINADYTYLRNYTWKQSFVFTVEIEEP